LQGVLYAGNLLNRRFEIVDAIRDEVFAGEAMADGGAICIETKSAGDRVLIEVRDTGHGNKPENPDQIFEPFFSTKPVGQGTGLGWPSVTGSSTNMAVESRWKVKKVSARHHGDLADCFGVMKP